jgi:1-deoxy-D-xylulose-5-phosphate synthase
VYSTFLNRAFDQVLFDVGLAALPVTFVLDRAGVTGEDGPSHHGMWDLSVLQVVPGLAIAAPRDAATLRAELREAVAATGPTVVRFPKGALGDDLPATSTVDGVDVLAGTGQGEVLIVAVGAMARTGLEVATRLSAQGVTSTVVDPRWVKPLPPGLVQLAGRHRLVATIEDGLRTGGVGSTLAQLLRDAQVDVAGREFGLPARYLPHGSRGQVLAEAGLTGQDIAREIVETVARRTLVLPAETAARSDQR